MSRSCIFMDCYGWSAEATLWGKSLGKYSESQPHSTEKRNSLNLFLKLIGETYFGCDLKEIRLLGLSRNYYCAYKCAFGASLSVCCHVGNFLNLYIIRKSFIFLTFT